MIIIHGNHLLASRQKLTDLIRNFSGETIRFEAEQFELDQLKQALESASLFGQKRLVVVENLFGLRPGQKKESLLVYLKKTQPKNLIVWEAKKVDGRTLAAFRWADIKLFKLPSILFRFLDSLDPKNKKNSLKLLHICLAQEAPEIVFYMLARQIRILIIAADLGASGLQEFPGWQRSKYLRQANGLGLKKLLFLYQQLLVIDYQQKTGRTMLPLVFQLDLLLASF